LLRGRGHRPGILTRGYKRNTPEAHLVLAPGEAVSAAQSGDEPQIFVRSGLAPVGIGADRWSTGMELRREFDVDVMILDDGFQHLRLAREVDIVLVDGLNPFGGGDLFPVGRMREPLESLARADVMVITRADSSGTVCAIERAVREHNPKAPVFHASVAPRGWVEHRTKQEFAAETRPFRRPGVFCGLGNPQTFRRTLETMGIEPVEWVDFDDHHRYLPHELRRIAHLMAAKGALSLLTTEKDAVNLCDDCDDLLAPLPLYWLRIAMHVDDERAFLDEIDQRCF
jgi:tetraacyldisaccharide 4'-kinase